MVFGSSNWIKTAGNKLVFPSKELYCFRVVPFGLCTATSALAYALEGILGRYEKFCSYDVDDVIIYSETVQEHYHHVETIISALSEAGMKLSLSKCQFFKKSVVFLGYVIDNIGISLETSRLDAIKNFHTPTSIKKVQSFLGLLNYYKKFIPNMAKICLPLDRLLKKGTKFKWSPVEELAFNEIK
ncbi:Reverse transcriptase (RNA-dependent DNA polymerase) [Popillia japonica]|uniref:Reverse transcriptase (RNA-dependent DNA polymerase) n=1 Tax=Popillia japonica TaxID=7064 RepID=A0AAW1JTA9_POPJA